MRKKKYSSLLLAGMLCVSLTACARTPSQALVAQKNNERLEETAKAEPKEGTELKDVAKATASTYDLDYKSDDGKVTIKADQAPVTLPEKDTIPMYHVYCGEISQDVATKLYNYFLPEGGYTTTGTDFTKAKVDQSILETKQEIAKYKDDDTLSDEEKQDMIKTQEEILASLEESRKDAPETDAAYQSGRKKWMRLLHVCWPAVLGMLFLIFMRGTASLKALFSTAEGVIVLVAMLVVCIAMSIRNYFFYWNRDDAQEKL